MGFFDKIKDTFLEDKQLEQKVEKVEKAEKVEEVKKINDKGLGDKAIEKALYGVKKYYEFKVKAVSQITDIQSEWHFYDESTQRRKVIDAKNEVRNLEIDKEKLQKSLEEEQEEVKRLHIMLEQNQDKLTENKQETQFKSDSEGTKNAIKKIELKNDDINSKIAKSVEKYNKILNTIKAKEEEIRDVYLRIIREWAFIPEEYNECKKWAEEHHINNNFTQLGLTAIAYYNAGNLDLAMDYTIKYFEKEKDNHLAIHTPIIDELFARYLILKKDFKEAKKIIEQNIEYYPERIEYHELLREIHHNLGEVQEALLEEKIIALLK